MRVGTRIKKCISYSLRQDHPHACGDKLINRFLQKSEKGSSPCVWGQDEYMPLEQQLRGIIPMRVGTSLRTCG